VSSSFLTLGYGHTFNNLLYFNKHIENNIRNDDWESARKNLGESERA